jgi:hypothetical protein
MVERNLVLFHMLRDALARLRLNDPILADRVDVVHADAADADFAERIRISHTSVEELPTSAQDSTASCASASPAAAATGKPGVAVYLDPMYPQGFIGGRALVKKDMQVRLRFYGGSLSRAVWHVYAAQMLHRLLASECGDPRKLEWDRANDAALFSTARKLATTRIVVKRPLNAPGLVAAGEARPHDVIKGRAHRFDVYYANRLR